jgi:flagellar M-ring protein FliF
MSVAVIVDHASQWDKDAKGNPVEKLVPRTPEELKKIHDQVASAVGFQAKRGDDLTVENIAFAPLTNPKEEAEQKEQERRDMVKSLAPYIILGILGTLVFFFVVFPLLRRISSALNRPAPLRVRSGEPGVELGEGAPAQRKVTQAKTVDEIQAEIEAELNAEGASGAPEAQRRTLIKKRIQESTTTDAETIASLVRSWILEDGR